MSASLTAEARMWLPMRKLTTWTLDDIEQLSEMPATAVRTYALQLVKANVAKQTGEEYRIVRDLGPLAPQFGQATTVSDPNAQAVLGCDSADRCQICARAREGVLGPVLIFCGEQRRFKLSEAAQQTGLDRVRLLRVLEKLVREGRIEIAEEGVERKGYGQFGPALRDPEYLVPDQAAAAARPVKRPSRRTCRDRIWAAIRNKRRFTRVDLREPSGCGESAIRDYCTLLVREGYLEERGRTAKGVELVLVNDPGPARPQIAEEERL